MTPIPNISQSLIKSLRKYEAGLECGLKIEAEWIKGVRFEPTTAMRMGQWFEYKATGALNYYGEVPRPDRNISQAPGAAKTKAKKESEEVRGNFQSLIDLHHGESCNIEACIKTGKFLCDELPGDLVNSEKAFAEKLADIKETLWQASPISTKFELAEAQALKFKDYMEEFKWEIKAFGIKQAKDGMSMTLDVEIWIPDNGYWPFEKTEVEAWKTWNEELAHCNLDLKFSGLIGNKWESLGWHDDTLKDSDHMLQPVQYAIVSGRDAFLFMVFGSTPAMDCKIYPVVVSEGAKEDHMQEVNSRRNQLKSAIRSGFTPHASFANCRNCPLAEGCEFRVTAPSAENVIPLEGRL